MPRLRAQGFASVVFLVLVLGCRVSDAREWKPLGDDGFHDPANPSLGLLQEPAEALGLLPPDTAGNQVNWVHALEGGYLDPRSNLYPGTDVEVLDLDIVMRRTGSANYVTFPHRPHTEWLDCSNCHDKIFLPKAGATPISMLEILSGEYCGRCHGAVAFPLTECNRCHNVSTSGPEALRE